LVEKSWTRSGFPDVPWFISASNLAYSPDPSSVDAKSTRTLTVSGIALESPSLFTKENANFNSSVGEFLVKSTLAPVKWIWFEPDSITKWSSVGPLSSLMVRSESSPSINIVLFKIL
jgi:hypothetical protein